MDIHLVVVRPFAGLTRGDVVTDSARIEAIVNSEHAANVVRVMTPSGKGN